MAELLDETTVQQEATRRRTAPTKQETCECLLTTLYIPFPSYARQIVYLLYQIEEHQLNEFKDDGFTPFRPHYGNL